MSTNEFTKVTSELEKKLADYGVMRGEAIEGAGISKPGDYNYFGIKMEGDKAKFAFDATPKQIQNRDMQMAIVAPEFDTFDMVAPVSFDGAKQTKNITALKNYLRKLFDEA